MVKNTKLIDLNAFCDAKYGSLVAVESLDSVPFEIRRIYYIYAVPEGERRGFHSHNALEQVLICVSGSATIHVRTPYESKDIILNNPAKGLYIGPMVWREMYDFSPGAVLLVLASEHYDEEDYVRDYDCYLKSAKEYFV